MNIVPSIKVKLGRWALFASVFMIPSLILSEGETEFQRLKRFWRSDGASPMPSGPRRTPPTLFPDLGINQVQTPPVFPDILPIGRQRRGEPPLLQSQPHRATQPLPPRILPDGTIGPRLPEMDSEYHLLPPSPIQSATPSRPVLEGIIPIEAQPVGRTNDRATPPIHVPVPLLPRAIDVPQIGTPRSRSSIEADMLQEAESGVRNGRSLTHIQNEMLGPPGDGPQRTRFRRLAVEFMYSVLGPRRGSFEIESDSTLSSTTLRFNVFEVSEVDGIRVRGRIGGISILPPAPAVPPTPATAGSVLYDPQLR